MTLHKITDVITIHIVMNKKGICFYYNQLQLHKVQTNRATGGSTLQISIFRAIKVIDRLYKPFFVWMMKSSHTTPSVFTLTHYWGMGSGIQHMECWVSKYVQKKVTNCGVSICEEIVGNVHFSF